MTHQGFRPDPVTGWSGRLSWREFEQFRRLFFEWIGLHLPDSKHMLVASRLGKRVAGLGLGGFADYLKLLESKTDPEEIQRAVDLITTNETFFFREPDHFQILERAILPSLSGRRPIKIWCGASSTGEEPYSLAMVLEDHLGRNGWQMVASDVNQDVLAVARKGLYPLDRADRIPEHQLKKHCRKGVGAFDGWFLMGSHLRDRIDFRRINLLDIPGSLADLDVAFLRNVLIYFEAKVRERILSETIGRLRPGGWLVLGHSESVVGLHLPPLDQYRPSVYRRPAGGQR